MAGVASVDADAVAADGLTTPCVVVGMKDARQVAVGLHHLADAAQLVAQEGVVRGDVLFSKNAVIITCHDTGILHTHTAFLHELFCFIYGGIPVFIIFRY